MSPSKNIEEPECSPSNQVSSDGALDFTQSRFWRHYGGKERAEAAEKLLISVFSVLLNYLPKPDILNCRQVCKRWKTEVDSYSETEQQCSQIQTECSDVNWCDPPRPLGVSINATAERLSLTVSQVLKKFISEFSVDGKTPLRNPFPLHSLQIHINDLSSTQLRFFRIFGVHIKTLELSIYPDHGLGIIIPPTRIVSTLLEFLNACPNLQTLTLLAAQNTVQCFKTVKDHQIEQLKVAKRIQGIPFFGLRKLKHLQLFGNVHMIKELLYLVHARQLQLFGHMQLPTTYVYLDNYSK